VPSRPMPISPAVAATTTWKSRVEVLIASVGVWLETTRFANDALFGAIVARVGRGAQKRVLCRDTSGGAATDHGPRRTTRATARRPNAIVVPTSGAYRLFF
jgi:hypothetical protein